MTWPIRRLIYCVDNRSGDHSFWRDHPAPDSDVPRRIAEHLALPYHELEGPLEDCGPDDLVFYDGSWAAFENATPTWTAEQRQARARRTIDVTIADPRVGVTEAVAHYLDGNEFPLALSPNQLSDKRRDMVFVYARRDVAAAIGLDIIQLSRSEIWAHCVGKETSIEEVVYRYMTKYWEMYGY